MKKLIFILVTFLPFLGFSQSIGIKGGVTFSKMDLPFNNDEKFLINPVFGLVYTQEIRRFRIFIEPSYATKGVAEDIIFSDASGNPGKTEKIKYKFSYVEIPILFGFNIINEDAFLGINVGAAPEILVDARIKSSSFKAEPSNTNLFGMDLIVGAYAGYRLTDNINATLNFRYGKGVVSPVQDEDETYRYFSPFITLNYKF